MIIDSHTDFSEGWDTRCIADLKSCNSDKPVLTMYPDNYNSRKPQGENKPPSYLRFKKMNENSGLPEIEGPLFKRIPNKCFRSLFLGCCFVFTSAKIIKEVPFDPHCPYVFFGEEISYAARLFTHGWDTFTPRSMVIRHMWNRQRPTFWANFNGNNPLHKKRRKMEREGYHRLKVIMGLASKNTSDVPIGIYGVGNKRTLSDFQNFIGVNFHTKEIYAKARLGIVDNPNYDEIFAKFGSLTEYHIALKTAL
jgi:GT2 family glycosyltransferase